MFNSINFKKITATSFLAILMSGTLVNQSGNNKAVADSCSNNGHGDNLPSTVTFDSDTKSITISSFDPSNPADPKRAQLIDDLVAGNFGKQNPYTITYDGTALTLEQAEYVVKKIVDIEKAKSGCDRDGDGIDDIAESGRDLDNPLDTDGDGLPNHLDTDSDGDGILDRDEFMSNQDNGVNYVTINSDRGYLDWTDAETADFSGWKKDGSNGDRDDLVRVYYHEEDDLYIKVSVDQKWNWGGINKDNNGVPSYVAKYLQSGKDYYPHSPKITNYSVWGTGDFDGEEMFLFTNSVKKGVGSNTLTIEYFSDEALTIPAEVNNLNFTLTDLDGKAVREQIVLTATDTLGNNSQIGFDRPSGSQIDDSQIAFNTIVGYNGGIKNEKGNVGVVISDQTHKIEISYEVQNPENGGSSDRHMYVSDLAWSNKAAPLVPGTLIDLSNLYTPNQPPVAVDDPNVSTSNNKSVTIPVLANDSDKEYDNLSILSVNEPSSGTVKITNNKKEIIYTPSSSFTGSTSFTYTVQDDEGDTDEATVTVTVNDNQAPTVNESNPTVTTNYETAKYINVVSDYVTDPDGDLVTIDSVKISVNGTETSLASTGTGSLKTPNGGEITIENGQIVYTPKSGFSGSDNFGYTVVDSAGNTASDTITVSVNPLANDFTVTTPYKTTTVIDSSIFENYIGGDTVKIDKVSVLVDGTEESLTSTETRPLKTPNGKITIENGQIIYTPAPSFSDNSDSFSYTVIDSLGNKASGKITVNVSPIVYAD